MCTRDASSSVQFNLGDQNKRVPFEDTGHCGVQLVNDSHLIYLIATSACAFLCDSGVTSTCDEVLL